MAKRPRFDTRLDPEDEYDPDNPRSVRTKRIGRFGQPGRPLRQQEVERGPMPGPDEVDTGDGTDAGIATGVEDAWKRQMLMQLLAGGMVDPGMIPGNVGGMPSSVPAENMGVEEIGQLFDPRPIGRQRRR